VFNLSTYKLYATTVVLSSLFGKQNLPRTTKTFRVKNEKRIDILLFLLYFL